jgi:hypothetical protein
MAFFDSKLSDEPKLEDSIAKLEEIQGGFKKNLANLHRIIEMLESKPELKGDIEVLKKDVESRANDLENEVERLREDLKSIQELLGMNLDNHNSRKT